MKLVADLGEFGLIEYLTNSIKLDPQIIGAGDDCAIIPCSFLGGEYFLVTTDSLVENRHFKWEYTSGFELGWKILAVSLSDIAAMGGWPKAVVIAVHLKKDFSVSLLKEIYSGIETLAQKYNVQIVGGDTVESEQNIFSLTAFGVSKKKPICRSGAKAGELLWLSGKIAGAFAGFYLLENKISDFPQREELLAAYNKPHPELELGQELLAGDLASSMIDVSDGLFQDALHLAEKSKVKILIDQKKIPLADGLSQLKIDDIRAISFGDDYRLLFTSDKSQEEVLKKKAFLIGQILPLNSDEKPAVYLQDIKDNIIDVGIKGYQHF